MSSRKRRSCSRGALVSGRGHLSWLDTIRTHLSSKNQLRLNSSCFGHLLAIPDLKFQGQLYNVLLTKLDKSSLQRRCLTFCINECEIEFGPREFCLMTGLRMNGWEEPPSHSKFHKSVFHGKMDILFCDIERKFVEECVETRGESEDSFVLALLYILYGILLIRSRKGKKIELKYMHLVDDLDKFNSYSWGQVAFDFLVRTTHRARDILDNCLAEGKKVALDANGFTIALQAWAYEIMPHVGRVCAKVVPDRCAEGPRLLRWAADKPFRFDNVLKLFNATNCGEFPVAIEFSANEQAMLRSLGAMDINDGPLSPAFLGEVMPKPRRLPTKSSVRKRRVKRQATMTPEFVYKSVVGERRRRVTTGADHLCFEMRTVMDRVRRLERTIRDLRAVRGDGLNSDRKFACSYSPTMYGCSCEPRNRLDIHNASVNYMSVSHVVENVSREVESLCDCSVCESSRYYVDNDLFALTESEVDLGSVMLNLAPYCNPVNMDGYEHGLLRPTKPGYDVCPYAGHHDPRDLEIDHVLLNEFRCWQELSVSDATCRYLTLPTGVAADPAWFSSIWMRRELLSDDHIDALLNLLLERLKVTGDKLHNCAVLEMTSWVPLTGINFKKVVEMVLPFATGVLPKRAPVKWHVWVKLCGIGTISNRRVAYEASIKGRYIKVYDPLSTSMPFDSVCEPFKVMARNLDRLLEYVGILDDHSRGGVDNRGWDVIQFRHPPQQARIYDCGILAVKYIECIICGLEVSVLDGERCGIYRRAYCAKLYEICHK